MKGKLNFDAIKIQEGYYSFFSLFVFSLLVYCIYLHFWSYTLYWYLYSSLALSYLLLLYIDWLISLGSRIYIHDEEIKNVLERIRACERYPGEHGYYKYNHLTKWIKRRGKVIVKRGEIGQNELWIENWRE